MTVLDFDDFRLGNARIDLLDKLQGREPSFKVTLFTVPMVFGQEGWVREVRQGRPWMEFALHGWDHRYLECRDWSKQKTLEILGWAEDTGVFVKGFKAPYWETSQGLYEGLIERGWWIADHDRNDKLRPAGLRAYKLDRPERVHGHIQDVCGNGLQEKFEYYAGLKGPFQFISEVMDG